MRSLHDGVCLKILKCGVELDLAHYDDLVNPCATISNIGCHHP